MSKNWFTSDHHFFHENVIRHCNRPFANASQMNDRMVEQWNSVVAPGDKVFHIGDMYWGKDVAAKRALRSRLNGTISLIPGNHDRPQQMLADGLVDEILPLIYSGDFSCSKGIKRRLVLCHYPMQEWDQFFRGSIHLHGHCHGNAPGQLSISAPIRRLDVSVDCFDFLPLALDDVLKELKLD